MQLVAAQNAGADPPNSCFWWWLYDHAIMQSYRKMLESGNLEGDPELDFVHLSGVTQGIDKAKDE
jgi:hypothetical protein